ncbi:restriction modification system DNA specificity subunit [Dyella jiangningensis]|nr:restriction modification system DNA specificity subunit [Dyella jiangningensis]AHX15950.1 restriction modification system DNA specificity subunit [Dyella jiangningensis]
MELRSGYKKTDAGVIPEDWETESILGITRQIMDFRGRTPKKLGMEWGGGEIPALSAKNVKMGFVDFDEECYLGSEALYNKWMTHGDVAKDDILFTTEAPLGNVALVPDGRKYILSQRTVLFKVDENKTTSGYLFQQLASDHFQKLLSDNSSGSTAKGIQRKKLEQLVVAKPPLSEQRVISEALSDMDALLSGLNKLIAKKRDLKQAAMQQLLTGQTRLPGFGGKWEVKRLADVLTIRHGKDQKAVASSSGQYPILATGGQIGWAAQWLYNRPSVLIGRKGTIDRPQYMETPFWTVDTLFYSELKDDNCAKFFYYRFCLIDWMQYNEASGVPSLNARTIEAVEFACPEAQEQIVIARVLSDMDVELAALEAQREKTRLLKQGMMQELLTGKTRLV